MKYFIAAFFSLSLFSSCYYDSEEDLYPATECLTTNVSFSADIVPILNNSCIGCHSASANLGNISLEGYNAVKVHVQNGKLLGSVKHLSGFSAMPQGAPKLESCKILKMEAWINAGSPNN